MNTVELAQPSGAASGRRAPSATKKPGQDPHALWSLPEGGPPDPEKLQRPRKRWVPERGWEAGQASGGGPPVLQRRPLSPTG